MQTAQFVAKVSQRDTALKKEVIQLIDVIDIYIYIYIYRNEIQCCIAIEVYAAPPSVQDFSVCEPNFKTTLEQFC